MVCIKALHVGLRFLYRIFDHLAMVFLRLLRSITIADANGADNIRSHTFKELWV